MNKVSQSHHLVLRKNVWYYRRRVPLPLVGVFKKKFIQESLGTPYIKLAIQRRELLDVQWSMRFAEAEKALIADAGSNIPTSPARALTEPLAIRLVQDFVEQRDRSRRKEWLAEPPLKGEEWVEARDNLKENLYVARGQVAYVDPDETIEWTRNQILKPAHVVIDEKIFPTSDFNGLVKRAAIELASRALAHFDDDHSRAYFDDLFNPSRPAPLTVGELVQQFLSLKEEDGAAYKVSRKHLDKQRANAMLIQEILGEDTLVRDLDWDACRAAQSTLARVPRDRTKAFKGMTLGEAIAHAEVQGKRRLSFVSQQQYLGTFKELMELAVNKGLVRTNHASAFRPLKQDMAAEAKRLPFGMDQLAAFFTGKFYKGCAASGDIPYRNSDKDWRFWLPLLCLFLGMRPREVCQMHTGDLKRTPHGTWFVDIAATEDEDDTKLSKSVKTLTSRRQIPLHPELEAIGFVRFVAGQEKAGDDPRLFRDLAYNKYDDPAQYALRRFREKFLPDEIIVKPRQTFYSFRHNWRDAARLIEAPADFLKGVGGWSDGKSTSDNYGTQSHPDHHIKCMRKIAFEGLDLSHLHPKA
jgi:integrase